jgi:hypothetical protein
MAQITLISLPLCAFTCAVSVYGVCSPARSPVRRAPCPTAPLAPIPLTPHVLGDDATQAAKDAAENDDKSVVDAYELML